MNQVNFFTQYKQLENHFTNGLVSILALSRVECPQLVESFLQAELRLAPDFEVNSFRVLPGEDGTADGELSGKNCCIWIESKIRSGTLSPIQIRQHLKGLEGKSEAHRRLVLLTPDDSRSSYINQFCSIDSSRILHVEWKQIYEFFARFIDESKPNTLSEIVRQFLVTVHDMIFTQDMAGVIAKVAFGEEAEVFADRYLDEMRAGEWTRWNTPRQYKNLDGTGRKLLLYDSIRKAITAEVEIKSVIRTDSDPGFPWTNEFAEKTLRVFDQPVELVVIQSVLENFISRSPFRNVTREQYRKLLG